MAQQQSSFIGIDRVWTRVIILDRYSGLVNYQVKRGIKYRNLPYHIRYDTDSSMALMMALMMALSAALMWCMCSAFIVTSYTRRSLLRMSAADDAANQIPKPSIITPTTGSPNNKDKFLMMYTCKLCQGRNANMISKVAYNFGMVVATCRHCKKKHLIADNQVSLMTHSLTHSLTHSSLSFIG